MVGIVVISHSSKIAQGAVELAKQMANNVKIIPAGVTKDNNIGTDIDLVLKAIYQAFDQNDGAIILFDLGSALMNAQMAVELLEPEIQQKVEIIDAALVEGTILAAINSSMNKSIKEIKQELINLKLNKI
ncbi:PTS-dependent dihydroxyacetone kinase phosphotransferase subunit DhaM [Mycoplasma capricolum subsp. capripneumoniae]|uniref:phosphoenolpyruvate--glycerone phosphotransferase n=1 Tax=Mycoplasma capricolum subsp. capripneumoniae 87001 TaxID=1124992 RepID=A0A9N7G762_MYCCC|nr:dihydroxyacetone kinase phosphoryl donor subunit DhaM [Mycoplasma capricolum]AJK51272.1 PTS mannose transporter subunit IID [Mycoplasma capricolum subsp. capripneumoniae 87001]AOQ21984.1 PTS-dependent dihydroxyacetone kinase phosphotransferase subunit DhaM [Mycoplasma capricolum subsp. capripneumoniae M1601]AQU77397.1 PTS-dependent dihydroxyacetone kinase phosphotransferase subunit DhaM [Mycoplasma capricolum subsp. capripneumoniae]KEY84284.1 Dihydroxyacetone kinase, phosphotransfer subunit 